jgi:hypothetical protein
MNIKEQLHKESYEAEHLDGIVHDAASSLATNANNDGLDGQVDFLKTTCGWSDENIMQALRDAV